MSWAGALRRAIEKSSPAAAAYLVPIVIGLVWPLDRHPEICGLLRRQLGEPSRQGIEMETGHLLIEMLGQRVNALFVDVGMPEQLDLSDHLVGERVRHHEAGVTGG